MYSGSILGLGFSYGPLVWALTILKAIWTMGPNFKSGVEGGPTPGDHSIYFGSRDAKYWVAVKELRFNSHSPETVLFTIYPQYGNLN